MKRLWVWLGKFVYPSVKYHFVRKSTYKHKEGRISVLVKQRVYKRGRYLRKEYWYGTIHVTLRVLGIRLLYRLSDSEEPIVGRRLSAKEEYSLRRDNDYVCLLRHILFMQETCDLTDVEKEYLHGFKATVMLMWPPRSNLDIQVCKNAFESTSDRVS